MHTQTPARSHAPHRRQVGRWFGVALAASVLLAACNKETPQSLVASAKDYATKGNHSAAVIQLRNALQQDPSNGEARLLLGQELLETRDPASAEKELRRASELKIVDDRVMPDLARALLEMRSYDILLKEFGTRAFSDGRVQASVRTYVAEAYLITGDLPRAAQAYADALRGAPDYMPARIGQVRLALREGRTDDALALVDGVLKVNPSNADAMIAKADVLLVKGDAEGAKALMRRAVQADPNALTAHFSLIALALEQNSLDEAAAQLEAARKVFRGDARVVYYDGVLAYRKGDINKARESTQQILKSAPDHVPTLLLASAIDLQSGQTASAEDRLRRALNKSPSSAAARRLLVAALLRSGQPARALEALQPLLGEGAAGGPLLLLAGETYLANGDLKTASDYFEQTTRADGPSAAAHMRLGQIALARGQSDEGVRELEAAASADSKDNRAAIALVLNYMRRNEVAKALEAARSLTQKQPDNPVSFQVLGGVQLLQKDAAGARASFERALAVSPAFLPAAFNLANLDLAESKADAAKKRLAALLERDPKNEQVMLAQAEVEARTGAPAKQVLALMERAVEANPQSSTARIALVNHHLRNKDPRAAVAAAQAAVTALPKDTRVFEMLSVAQEASGDKAAATDSLNRLVQMRPGVAEPLVRLAGLYVRSGNPDRAVDALQRALKVAPQNRQLDRDLVALLISQGKHDQALKQARDLQARAPTFGGGFELEGDVLFTQKRFAEAERAYRSALKVEPTSGLVASKVTGALYASGRNAEADAFTRKWLTDNPRDAQLRVMLADRAMRVREYSKAAEMYRTVLANDSNNVVALNNLAWIGGETGDAKAVSYAERAAALAPLNASILETLGTLLVKRGETARGLEVLGKARTIAPTRLDLRLSQARALVAAGQKDAARTALREIADTKEDSAERRTAAEMLQKL